MANKTPNELLEECFPKLHSGNYQICSRPAARYNCVAFVNGDEQQWWEHPSEAGYGRSFRRKNYWPPHLVRFGTMSEAWIALFEAQGYVRADGEGSEKNEVGFEKIAIYVKLTDLSSPSHVAKSDGYVWKSKLGKGNDIEHTSLELLEGEEKDEYGIIGQVLKRAIN